MQEYVEAEVVVPRRRSERAQGFVGLFFIGPRITPLSRRVFRRGLGTAIDCDCVEVTVWGTGVVETGVVASEVIDFLDFLAAQPAGSSGACLLEPADTRRESVLIGGGRLWVCDGCSMEVLLRGASNSGAPFAPVLSTSSPSDVSPSAPSPVNATSKTCSNLAACQASKSSTVNCSNRATPDCHARRRISTSFRVLRSAGEQKRCSGQSFTTTRQFSVMC